MMGTLFAILVAFAFGFLCGFNVGKAEGRADVYRDREKHRRTTVVFRGHERTF